MTPADVVDWTLESLAAADKEGFQAYDTKPDKHGKPCHKSFDCRIMDVADDIAYGVHDHEDAIALGLIKKDRFADQLDGKCSYFLDGT